MPAARKRERNNMANEVDEQQLTIAAYKDIFATEKGKRVLNDLSRFCLEDYLPDIFDENNANKTNFNLGANKVIRYIRWMLKRKTEKKQEKVIS